MRENLREVLFEDEDRSAAEQERDSVVSKAGRSPSAKSKGNTRTTAEGLIVQKFPSVLADLTTLCRHVVRCGTINNTCNQLTKSTTQQRRYLELMNVTA